jgi:hypothetical protein
MCWTSYSLSRLFFSGRPSGGDSPIVDPKDAPILNAAILENADVLISGDNHFLSLGLERPIILTPAQYLDMVEGEAQEHLFSSAAEHHLASTQPGIFTTPMMISILRTSSPAYVRN